MSRKPDYPREYMTIRAEIAARILAGIVTHQNLHEAIAAREAVKYADALIEELSK